MRVDGGAEDAEWASGGVRSGSLHLIGPRVRV